MIQQLAFSYVIKRVIKSISKFPKYSKPTVGLEIAFCQRLPLSLSSRKEGDDSEFQLWEKERNSGKSCRVGIHT